MVYLSTLFGFLDKKDSGDWGGYRLSTYSQSVYLTNRMTPYTLEFKS